jgi:hypothetical protein
MEKKPSYLEKLMNSVAEPGLYPGWNIPLWRRDWWRFVSLLLVLLVAHLWRVNPPLWIQALPILDPVMDRPKRINDGFIGQVLFELVRLKLEEIEFLLAVECCTECTIEDSLSS